MMKAYNTVADLTMTGSKSVIAFVVGLLLLAAAPLRAGNPFPIERHYVVELNEAATALSEPALMNEDDHYKDVGQPPNLTSQSDPDWQGNIMAQVPGATE